MLTDSTKIKIQEVLKGIGLKTKGEDSKIETYKIKEDSIVNDPDHPFNQIVHVNSVDQKIFSVLYNAGKG